MMRSPPTWQPDLTGCSTQPGRAGRPGRACDHHGKAQQEAGVHGLITASAVMDWSYGASILTFVFPMLLFIGVAAALYVVYTKPHLVPGHHFELQMRLVSHTAA